MAIGIRPAELFFLISGKDSASPLGVVLPHSSVPIEKLNEGFGGTLGVPQAVVYPIDEDGNIIGLPSWVSE